MRYRTGGGRVLPGGDGVCGRDHECHDQRLTTARVSRLYKDVVICYDCYDCYVWL